MESRVYNKTLLLGKCLSTLGGKIGINLSANVLNAEINYD